MKQVLRFLALAVLLAAPWGGYFNQVQAQSTLTVNDGTDNNSKVPIYGLYADTYGAASECVIPADDLTAMVGGTIESMTFYLQSSAAAAWTATFQVYLGEMSGTTLTTISGPGANTVVYTGTLDATGTELTITFDDPYVYGGEDLVIGSYVDVQGNWKSANFYGVNTTGNTARYRDVGSGDGSATQFLPKTTFTYTPGSGPVCEKPATFEVSNVSATGATLTWTGGSGTYNVEYKTAAAADWTPLLTGTTATTHNMTSLTSATDYQVRVQSVCSSETSGWKTANFTTPCEAIPALGYTENFDGITVPSAYTPSSQTLPNCWNSINTTTYNSYKVYPSIYNYSNANSTPNCLCLVSYDDYSYYTDYDPQPQYAILPEMTGLAGKQVTMMVKGYNSSSTFHVGLMTDPADASTFTEIINAGNPSLSTSYQEFTYDVPGDAAANSRLAIMIDAADYYDNYQNYNGVYIDDISIAEPPTCRKPSGLKLETPSARTAHTATLSWTNGGTETEWEIAYSTESSFDPDGVTPVDVTTNPYTLTGLTNGTTYYAYVRANCGGGDYSAWCSTKATFTTTSGTQVPTGLAATPESPYAATVTWTGVAANDNHASYDLFYSQNSTPSPNNETVPIFTGITAESYLIPGLLESTTYYVWVRDNCGADGYSDWSSRATFTTPVFCPAPTGVAVSSRTAHGATISWTGTSDSYKVMVGEATVTATNYDFEDNAISTDFDNDDTYPWTVTTDATNNGNYSIKSGNYNVASSTSEISLTVEFSSDGSIGFAARCSSEQTSASYDWDYGTFYIDGEQRGDKFINSTTFESRNYNVTAGTHTFKWKYKKDGGTNSNDDCFYVDDISITSSSVASWETYDAAASPFVLNDNVNIDPETDYAVKVKGVCDGTESAYVSDEVLFTTLNDCPKPTEVESSNIGTHIADISWTGNSSSFNVTLGQSVPSDEYIDEDFHEGVPASWTNTSTNPWVAENGYIKSGNAGVSSSTSEISVEVTLTKDGVIEFDAECRGEGTGSSYYDNCIFSIDGTEMFKYGAQRTDDGFVHYKFNVSTGTHTFTWKYSKDSSVDKDGDYFAIDNVYVYESSIVWDDAHPINVTENNVHLTDLDAGTVYYVKVAPSCDETLVSDSATFTTIALPKLNVVANSWYAIASPVHNSGNDETVAGVTNLIATSPVEYDFLRYVEVSCKWESYKEHTADFDLEQGRGYIYRRSADATLEFDGEPNTGNVVVNVTKTADGWNLIGNPYMAQYTPTTNFYILNTNGMWVAKTQSYSNKVKVGEAFLVKVSTAGTYNFTAPATKAAPASTIAFTVSNDEFTDIAYARFSSEEGLPKISHLNPEAPMLSIDGYAIANLNEGTESFPMSFSGQGSYTLTVSGNTDVTGYLHLVDRLTGRDIDLLSTPSYSFTGSPVSDRFTVKLTPDANEGSSTTRFAIFDGNSLIVNGEGTLEVYDVMGRRLMSAEVTGSEYRIPGSDLHTGVYVLRMNGNSQKIVIK